MQVTVLRLATAAILIALALATTADARAPQSQHVRVAAPPDASRARLTGTPGRVWLPLSRRVSRRWTTLQGRNGAFPDVILGSRGRSRYGEAMLGYSLILSGLRDRRRAYLNAGLRAITWATRRRGGAYDGDAPFENLAIASSYTAMRRNAPGYRGFRRVRRRWERFMRSRVRVYIHRAGEPTEPLRRGYWNKWLVESIAMLEFLRSGLSSRRPNAALAQQGDTYRRIVSVMNEIVPDIAAQATVPNGRGDSGLILSDPPENPLAYHALSMGLIARGIRLLGPAAGQPLREALMRMVDASWSLIAPDGDLAYAGRSQEQAWALSFTAYGAQVASSITPERWRADRARGVAQRAIGRLVALHPLTPNGLAITPSVGRDPVMARVGIDRYAHMVDYNGLTLVGLNWALAETRGRRTSMAPVGSDSNGALVVDKGNPAMATVRTANLWFAVKRSRSSLLLQYDFGLVALKRQTGSRWRDVMPLRPIGTLSDSAGPIYLGYGVRAYPVGETLEARPDGTVVINGGFARDDGVLVRRAQFTYVPVAGGVRLSFQARRGDNFEVSSFHRSTPSATSDTGFLAIGVAGEGMRIAGALTRLRAPRVDLSTGYASGMEWGLTRARATFEVGAPGDVAVTYGAIGG